MPSGIICYPAFQAEALPDDAAGQEKLKQIDRESGGPSGANYLKEACEQERW